MIVGVLLAVTVRQFVVAQDQLEDELNPARVELSTLLALYVDQETAERGYILTGRQEFLEPYDAAAPGDPRAPWPRWTARCRRRCASTSRRWTARTVPG